MLLRSLVLTAFLAGLSGGVVAQDAPAEDRAPASVQLGSKATDDSAEASSGDPDKKTDAGDEGGGAASSRFKPLPGDVVVLKNGKSITGIQVLRETPVAVEIVTAPGAEPMRVPRKQVQEVQYDDVDPSHMPEVVPEVAAAPDIMEGNELQPEFHAKLMKPLSDAPISFENTDVVEMLRDLRERAGVPLVMLPGVHNTPVAARQWTVTIPAGTPLMSLLQDAFAKQFPKFQVVFEFDRVVVKTEQDVLPPAAPAPAAPAPPTPASPAPATTP